MPWGATGTGLFKKVMGIVMKKLALLATALTLVSGSALAADLRVKAVKAPPVVAFALRANICMLAEWDAVEANLEQIARHRGVRFVTAPEAATA